VAKIIGVRFGYTPDDLLLSSASSNAKVLYSALTRYCNAEDRAWPTEQTLTNRLGWSESTVRRAIAELLRLGWLSKRQSRVNHGGTWAHNVYTLNTKPTLQRKKLRRHRRSNLTGRTRENEFQAKSNASRLDGAPHSPRQEEWPPPSTEELAEARSYVIPDAIGVSVEEWIASQDWERLRGWLDFRRQSPNVQRMKMKA
jgi:GntR family transcriptional regulator